MGVFFFGCLDDAPLRWVLSFFFPLFNPLFFSPFFSFLILCFCSEYSADLVVKAALHGHASSVRERLIREVMSVKHINYQRANAIVNDMSHANSSGLPKFKVPFHAGATLGFVACWASLPLVFDYSTALWFNTAFVTTEVPPAEDLETWLEVGAWTWNWNEPFMGTLMFQFLALEFMRNQAINVGLKPYTEWVQSRRATRLADLFPCYSRTIVRDFAKSNAQFGEDYTGTSKEEIQ